jgi:hypothetical protein
LGAKLEASFTILTVWQKLFYDLSEKDILALAISMEEEDGKTRSAPWNWRISSGRRD